MPLPKIETPRYELTIPSTKKTVTFRPFLVKEEKVLLIAQESGNRNNIVKAMRDIAESCIEDKIDGNKLTVFDLEYIFVKLRTKSVGEVSSVNLTCSECKKPNLVDINLDSIELVEGEKMSNDIKLTEEVGIVLQHPTVKDIIQMDFSGGDYDHMMELIKLTIQSIYDRDGIYSRADATQAEINEFIDSLNRQQLEKIGEYIKSCPRIIKKIGYTCGECGHNNNTEISGLESFFG